MRMGYLILLEQQVAQSPIGLLIKFCVLWSPCGETERVWNRLSLDCVWVSSVTAADR